MIEGLIDMHCHIVPGVDDGAADLMTAAKMMKMEYENGVAAIIVTPHYRRGMFETPQRKVEKQFRKIYNLTQKSRSGMKAYLGCEYHTNTDMVSDLLAGKRPTMAGSRYVLTEFSSAHSYLNIRNQVYELVAAGFKPIVAHVERYPCLVKNIELIEELIELGGEIQLTSESVAGRSSRQVKRFCNELLKAGNVHYIASDAHDLESRKPNLQACAVYLEKKFGKDMMEQILIKNPKKIILSGEEKKDETN